MRRHNLADFVHPPNTPFLAILLLLWVNFSFSQSIPDSLLLQLPNVNTPAEKVNALNQLAWDNKSEKPLDALKYTDLALRIAKINSYSKGIGDAYHTRGMIRWYMSEYEEASKYFFEALKIREASNDSIGLARSFNNIGNVYYRQDNDSLALVYYQKALDYRELLKDSIGLIYSYNNLGDVMAKVEKEQEALKFYDKSLRIAKNIKELKGQAFVATNLGEYFQERKRYPEGLIFYNQALETYEQLDFKYEIALVLNHIAEIYLAQNQADKAIPLLEKSAVLSAQTEGKSVLSSATKNLSLAYAQLSEFEKAYEYQLAHQQVATEILNKSKDEVVLGIQAKYQNEKEQRQRDEALREKERELNSLTTFVLFFALITIGVLFFLSMSRYVFQSRMNRLLQEKNQRIEKQNQTLMKNNNALEQFAYIASHDLKEPLRTIGSYSTLVQRKYQDQLDEEAKEYFGFIIKGVKQMYSLLEDVLAYARTDNEAGMRKEQVNMNEILSSVEDSLQKIVHQKNVSISAEELPIIWANPFQMHQVLQNLISNGIKFNHKEQIKIQISAETRKDRFIFSVKDNGIGIDPKYQKQIFNLFHRLDNRKYSGTGLGLAICAKIVANHNGRIWVDSKEGQGSTFYFSVGHTDHDPKPANISTENAILMSK